VTEQKTGMMLRTQLMACRGAWTDRTENRDDAEDAVDGPAEVREVTEQKTGMMLRTKLMACTQSSLMACRGAGRDRTENRDDAEDKVDGLQRCRK